MVLVLYKNLYHSVSVKSFQYKHLKHLFHAFLLRFVLFLLHVNNNLKDDVVFILDWALTKSDKISPCLVRKLEKENPNAFVSLLTETYKGYYSRPDIRQKFGLSKKPVHPSGYLVVSESNDYLAQITDTVRARGPIYRDPTGG